MTLHSVLVSPKYSPKELAYLHVLHVLLINQKGKRVICTIVNKIKGVGVVLITCMRQYVVSLKYVYTNNCSSLLQSTVLTLKLTYRGGGSFNGIYKILIPVVIAIEY